MIRVATTFDVDVDAVDLLGIKEAAAMALETLGCVRVLYVDVQGPEQTRIEGMGGGGAVRTARLGHCGPRNGASPAHQIPKEAGQAPAKRNGIRRTPSRTPDCCFNCARYHQEPTWDASGRMHWGVCTGTGQLVDKLLNRCREWKEVASG